MNRTDAGEEMTTSERARREGLKRIPRRHPMRKGEAKSYPSKVRVTMYLDADVLEHFKSKAAEPNAAPYQTQINNELRKALQKEPSAQWTTLLNQIVGSQALIYMLSNEVVKEIVSAASRSRAEDFGSLLKELEKNTQRCIEQEAADPAPATEPEWSR